MSPAEPAAAGHPVGLDRVRGNHLELVDRPGIEAALQAVAGCTLTSVERTGRVGEVTQKVLGRLQCNPAEQFVLAELPGVDVRPDEQRIVHQELLEVRNTPFPVHRPVVKSSADLVVDTSFGHPAESGIGNRCRPGHPAAAGAEHELDGRSVNRARASPNPPFTSSNAA